MRAALLGVLVVCSAARGLSGQVFAATLSPGGSGTRSSATRAAAACAVDSVGLIDPATGQWNVSSCLEVDWADDAETASVLADGTVLVYVTPSGGEDTYSSRISRQPCFLRKHTNINRGDAQSELARGAAVVTKLRNCCCTREARPPPRRGHTRATAARK